MGSARFSTKRLGEKLRQIREALGLSQSEMLRRLGFEDELWYTQVSAYETGRREPPLIILMEYARAAGVCPELLIDDELDLPTKLPSTPKHRH
ncbi:MAG TPA: helix-turn-helix transcriptional regulator [Pyrinomonadaceae bacterium]|jgi:transcriptional regulator with XRE-family HTH domain|nr:helix-turn-helix transcriptional regulator [Pyrinomonadaceae bacterium]